MVFSFSYGQWVEICRNVPSVSRRAVIVALWAPTGILVEYTGWKANTAWPAPSMRSKAYSEHMAAFQLARKCSSMAYAPVTTQGLG